jgi:hypothetical protein
LNIPLLLLLLAVVAPPSAPDTLVVCPAEFRPALAEWELYRSAQGHVISVIEPPASAERLRESIHNAARFGHLKHLLLIGDEAARGNESRIQPASLTRTLKATVPTSYVPAKVNIHWGSTPEIASDTPFADSDGDGVPDLAVGRIPAHSAAELAAVMRKVIRYEQQIDHGSWEKSLNIVSGSGGFGATTDALIAAAARQVLLQTVPSEFVIQHLACAVNDNGQLPPDIGLRARRQLNDGGLAWVFLGHGSPSQLIGARTATGWQSLLSTKDVPDLRCGPHNPLAVLIACYTGAMDAPQGCLAEDLLLAEEGPVAVIAASRVTMPYGNAVIGYELLRACFQDRPAALGEILRLAQQRTLAPTANDQLRSSLDALAAGLSPAPVDLLTERREHVLMYHLIGDPLTRLHLAKTRIAQSATVGATK